MPSRKRARYLRNQRARVGRRLPLAPGLARFECPRCRLAFAQPGLVLGDLIVSDTIGGPGQTIPGDHFEVSAPCPRCGASAQAMNQRRVEVEGVGVTGFVDNDNDLAALFRAVDELRALREDATVEEVVEVLEQAGPIGSRLARYIRDNSELFGLGIGALSIIVSILLHLLGNEPNTNPPPLPDGVTHEQMERLIAEVVTDTSTPAGDGDDRAPREPPREPQQRKE